MKVFHYTLAGDVCTIKVPEYEEDLTPFYAFMAQDHPYLAFDTESTGLDLFSRGHQLRLFQIGNGDEAWVLRADRFRDACLFALRQQRTLIAHNAPFDALTIERHLGVPIEELLPRIWDTKIMAHIIDPRSQEEGGVGLEMKTLSAIHVDPKAPDMQSDLTKVFNSFGWTKKTGWARISIDHMTYLIYAGLDVLLTYRLFMAIRGAVGQYSEISKMEHRLQFCLASCTRRGMLLDVDYIKNYLTVDLHNEYIDQCDRAYDYGVENVHSNEQIIAGLLAMGEELTETTPKGQLQVDRAVLEPLADIDRFSKRIGARQPNPLAEAVFRAKRAKKWMTAYAEAFLEWRDANDRIHPSINSLQARTARMSISNPALQQLPASDWRVRRAFIPDPGHVIISSDYSSVEMRVLAAVSRDHTMRQVIAEGLDLHSFTAERVFPGFDIEKYKEGDKEAKQQRSIAKNIGFGKVYGGGAKGVSRLTGADEEGVRTAMAAYDATFPGVRRYSYQLINMAKRGIPEVITPIGRRLPLDTDRLYAATNYVVQSTARDLLAKAIIRVFDAGLGQYMLVPIHDEILGQAPVEQAQEIVDEIGSIMNCEFQGVQIVSEPEVVGASWGAGYKAPSVLPPPPTYREPKLRDGQWAQGGLF